MVCFEIWRLTVVSCWSRWSVNRRLTLWSAFIQASVASDVIKWVWEDSLSLYLRDWSVLGLMSDWSSGKIVWKSRCIDTSEEQKIVAVNEQRSMVIGFKYLRAQYFPLISIPSTISNRAFISNQKWKYSRSIVDTVYPTAVQTDGTCNCKPIFIVLEIGQRGLWPHLTGDLTDFLFVHDSWDSSRKACPEGSWHQARFLSSILAFGNPLPLMVRR